MIIVSVLRVSGAKHGCVDGADGDVMNIIVVIAILVALFPGVPTVFVSPKTGWWEGLATMPPHQLCTGVSRHIFSGCLLTVLLGDRNWKKEEPD